MRLHEISTQHDTVPDVIGIYTKHTVVGAVSLSEDCNSIERRCASDTERQVDLDEPDVACSSNLLAISEITRHSS
jgi:hypothetical protein